jgi:hypothetical protein
LGHNVYVLDGANGTELHSLDVSGVELVGTFYLNLVGAAEDGAVFACNLTTSGIATEFVIYRWENDDAATVATVAYRGDPGAGTDFRWGDTFVVRGRGENTQLLAASRNRTVVALFTTTEGANFTATLIDTADATAGNFGLGLAFGGGDSFWGKATGQSLRHVGFDLTAGTGTTLHDYGTTVFPTFISAIAVDPPNGLLAALAFQTPDNTHLYDVSDLTAGPVLLDQEFFAADNENANGTGAGAFGGDRLFMLDSNNGLAAFTVKKTVTPPAQPVLSGAKVEGGLLKFDLTGESGRTYLLQATTDFATWSDLDSYPAAAPKLSISVPLGPQPYRFFRAKVQ